MYVYSSPEPGLTTLEVKLSTDPVKLNEFVSFNVFNPQPVPFVVYSVFSKGVLRRSKKVKLTGGRGTFKFMFDMRYAPETQVIVYYVQPDGRMVVATVTVPFRERLENQVAVTLSKSVYEPGSNVSLVVSSERHATVSLLAIDQNVLTLATGNDITKADVFNELTNYNVQQTYWADATTYIPGYYEVNAFEPAFTVGPLSIGLSRPQF